MAVIKTPINEQDQLILLEHLKGVAMVAKLTWVQVEVADSGKGK